MKYIIDVPEEAVGFMDGEMSFFVEPKIKDERRRHYVFRIDEEDVSIYTEPNRKVIEDEVWSFVDFLENKLMASDYDDIFDDNSPYDHMTYQEAKAKYDEWKDKWKKEKEEIRVGDEVANLTDYKGVVVKIYDDKTVNIMWDNGNVGNCKTNTFHKTGRHFDEVAELLEKMRGEE